MYDKFNCDFKDKTKASRMWPRLQVYQHGKIRIARNSEILKLHDINKYQTLKFMFLPKNDVLPDLFKEMFSFRSN